MIYEKDKSYEFPVVGGLSPADDSFLISVNTPNGQETIKFKKFLFQRKEGYNTSTIHCRVRDIDPESGLPLIILDISHYVYELYSETFANGQPFICEVVNIPDNPASEPYTIADNNGIFFRIYESQGLLTKGQKLLCRLTRLTPTSFALEPVNQPSRLQFYSLEQLLNETDTPKELRPFICRFFNESPQLDRARSEIACGNARWVFTASVVILENLPEWFISADLRRKNVKLQALINAFRKILLYLLEDSSYLNGMPTEQRRSMQHQLTEMADKLEPYSETLELIANAQENKFIERLLDHLQRSGYLYHPARRFAVLMLIFRLQPEKVAVYLSRIFESIFGRDLENWSREPFRDAFLEQFEIYVRQARRKIDALPIAESREAKSNLENILTAIALQLLLAHESTNTSRLWALYYRYISLLRPLNSEILLTKAFLSLLDADINNRLTYQELKQPMMMMTRAMVMPTGDVMHRIQGTHRYSNKGVEIAVSSEGIQISQSGREDVTERVIPEGLMPWLHPQIIVNGVRGLSGTRMRKLSEHNIWWREIESSLFDKEITPVPGEIKRRTRPTVGDDVYIVFDDVSSDGSTVNPVFTCHVQDDDYESVSGTLYRSQIVDYNLRQPTLRATRTEKGTKRGFYAKVIADDISGSGFRFSLRETIDSYIEDHIDYEQEYIAKIKGVSDRDYSAISELGIGLFIERDPDNPEFSVGDMVKFRFTTLGKQGSLKGVFVEYSDAQSDFCTNDTVAFEQLLTNIGENDESEEDVDFQNDIVDNYDRLPAENVREIIEMIRFKAIAETNLITAYDYLRLGRLLALAIDNTTLAENLLAHAALLTQHQFFATNSRIDADKLGELAPAALADPFLKVIYHRLEMVSWLDHPERNSALYKTSRNPSNELEGAIASMVLAYNMLHAMQGDANNSISTDIKNKIMEKLNVNNETRQSKYYGSESKYLEFKTSLVYPAVKPGEDIREAPEEQRRHILSRIAGFLNASGGQLYLGVNNDGYEVGMPDDFRYYERQRGRVSIGKHQLKVTDIDSLCVFIENLVDSAFGHTISRKVNIAPDTEAEKGVIRIEIEQSLDPVFFEGRLFVRQSGQSTREYHGEDIEVFVRERKELKAERQHMLATQDSELDLEDTEESDLMQTKEEVSIVEEVETPTATKDVESNNLIATSLWQPNVLHNYDTDYVEPHGYLYFFGENTIVFSKRDKWIDVGQEDCRLVIAVAHELSNEYLILGFEEEKALKVPLSEIFREGENVELRYNDSQRLIFAGIATREDSLLCIAADSSNALWRRAIKLNSLENGHLKDEPKRFHDAPINHTVAYEIIDSKSIDSLADCLGDVIPSKRFGVTVRAKEGTASANEKLQEIYSKCAPSN